MPVRIRNGATRSRSTSMSAIWASSRPRSSPCATVSRGEWSVSTTYSWPSPIAVRTIDSIVAPPSLHLLCMWQSPFKASR